MSLYSNKKNGSRRLGKSDPGGLAYFMVSKSGRTRPSVLNCKTDIGGHKGEFFHFLWWLHNLDPIPGIKTYLYGSFKSFIKGIMNTILKATSRLSPFLSGSSDWVNYGDVTFRTGQLRWYHLQNRSTKVTSPSDQVNQGDVTFRTGQLRWHHLQIRSTKVTSPSDQVN